MMWSRENKMKMIIVGLSFILNGSVVLSVGCEVDKDRVIQGYMTQLNAMHQCFYKTTVTMDQDWKQEVKKSDEKEMAKHPGGFKKPYSLSSTVERVFSE